MFDTVIRLYILSILIGINEIIWYGLAAYIVTLLLLIFTFRAVRPRLRGHAVKFDEKLAAWGRHLRYQDPIGRQGERVWLTWFFRFWTNFASAPSLSFWSLAVPLYVEYRFLAAHPSMSHATMPLTLAVKPWLLPGICYAGSMLLSFVLKRVFRRLRPERVLGAFGHKLKDPSFPSGHSLTSLCFWGMMAVSLALAHLPALGVVLFGLGALAIVLFTGTSRIYLGVHWPSDVAGGYVIGIVWCTLFLITMRWFVL